MGWIEDYLAYTERQVSPRVFHLWSAIATIAGVLERRCWVPILNGAKYIYPGQIMVILVSKSAVTKKTTAGSMATELLKELEPWQVNMLPKKLSPSSLLESLQRLDEEKQPARDLEGRRVNSTGFIWAEELGAMFTTETFAESLATQINQLNDCPRGEYKVAYRTWEARLWQPCVTMLGCITPKGIATELPRAARTAGFFGRLLLVHRNYTDRSISLLDDTAAGTLSTSPRARRQLVAGLAEMSYMRGKFTLTDEARQWFNDWYYKVHEVNLRNLDLGEMESTGYPGRKDAHVIRVTTVLSASDRRDKVIEKVHFQKALKYLEEIEREFPAALRELGTSQYSEFDRRLLEVVERYGKSDPWVPEQRLRRAMMALGGDRRFQESRETLQHAGEIELQRREKVWYWRRVFTSGRLLRGTEETPSLRVVQGGKGD